jgi:peptidoglycan L-alanyl-D-glutamate endopeptidase CwlK
VLVEKYLLLAEDFAREQVPASLMVTCTYRSPEEQAVLYAQGRTTPGKVVTNADGVTNLSAHNHYPSRAIDVAVLLDGKVVWRENLYEPLVPLAARHGLVSGGAWRTFKDWPHIEMRTP